MPSSQAIGSHVDRRGEPTGSPRISSLAAALLFALASLCIVMPLASLAPIAGPSEAREAHITRIMAESGDWVLPRRAGILPSKPPLTHWINAGFASAIGATSNLVVRMSSLLAGFGTILFTVLLAARCAERLSEWHKRWCIEIGCLCGAILTTTYGFLQLMGDARVDMTYTFFVTLAAYLFIAPFFSDARDGRGDAAVLGERHFAGFFAACALAVLAKGPIGVVLPMVCCGATLAYLTDIRSALAVMLRPRLGWLAFVAIAAPWYALAVMEGGEGFIGRQIVFENLARFTGGKNVNSEPPWFYLVSILRTAFPWSLFLFAFLPRLATSRSCNARSTASQRARRLECIFGVWCFAGLVLLSLASGKRHSYTAPLFPAMSIFVGLRLAAELQRAGDALRGRTMSLFRPASQVLLALLLMITALIGALQVPYVPSDPILERGLSIVRENANLLQLLLLASAGAIALGHARSGLGAGLSCWIGLYVLLATSIFTGMAVKNDLKGVPEMARALDVMLPENAPIGVVRALRDEASDAILYHLGRDARIYPPIPADLPCGQKLIALDTFFQRYRAWSKRVELEVREIGRVNQFLYALTGRDDREFVLFECVGEPKLKLPGAEGDAMDGDESGAFDVERFDAEEYLEPGSSAEQAKVAASDSEP